MRSGNKIEAEIPKKKEEKKKHDCKDHMHLLEEEKELKPISEQCLEK